MLLAVNRFKNWGINDDDNDMDLDGSDDIAGAMNIDDA